MIYAFRPIVFLLVLWQIIHSRVLDSELYFILPLEMKDSRERNPICLAYLLFMNFFTTRGIKDFFCAGDMAMVDDMFS